MFEINYSLFIEDVHFSSFRVHYMPGLKVSDMSDARCIVNIDSRSVYIYH